MQTEPTESITPLPEADFHLEDHGSILLLRPVTTVAREWVNAHIGADNGYQPLSPTVTIEHRYVHPILEGIQDDGLTCNFNCELR